MMIEALMCCVAMFLLIYPSSNSLLCIFSLVKCIILVNGFNIPSHFFYEAVSLTQARIHASVT
jgi:hypothetical protein